MLRNFTAFRIDFFSDSARCCTDLSRSSEALGFTWERDIAQMCKYVNMQITGAKAFKDLNGRQRNFNRLNIKAVVYR
jgi:hypothetical protein